MHFPKTGGTSLSHAISRYYRPWQRKHLNGPASKKKADALGEDLFVLRRKILRDYLSNPRYRYVRGHFDFDEDIFHEFSGKWSFFTVLRDPVSRWLSHFFYNRYRLSDHYRITEDIDTFSQSRRGKQLARFYVRFLTGHLPPGDERESPASAIEALERFDFVGVLEKADVMADDFERRFGVRLDIERKNPSPLSKTKQKQQATKEVRARVEEICAPDLEVYRHALGMIGRPRR